MCIFLQQTSSVDHHFCIVRSGYRMAPILLQCLVLFLCYDAVTSQGTGSVLTSRPTSGTGIEFPNIDKEPVAAYLLVNRKEPQQDKNEKISAPPSSVNEVDPMRRFELASEAVHNVATRLHHLVDPEGRKNYLVSPLSVALLVGQVMLAARGDSERRLRELLLGTRMPRVPATYGSYAEAVAANPTVPDNGQQVSDLDLHTQLGGLLKHLHDAPGQTQDDDFYLTAASAFFMSHDLRLKSSFQEAVSSLYGSELLRLNFSGNPVDSLKILNHWANRHTAGRIPTIFQSPLPLSTAVVLVNAVYFRSEWETPFDPEWTVSGNFRLNGTNQIKVQQMRGQLEINYVDHAELACRMIVLPYKSSHVNMYVILPNRNITDMKDFAIKLSTRNITSLIRALTLQTVTIVMPKMALTSTYSLKDPIMRYRQQAGSQTSEALVREPLPTPLLRSNRRNRTSTTFLPPSTTTLKPQTTTTQRPQTMITQQRPPVTTQRPRPRPVRPMGVRPWNNQPKDETNNTTAPHKPWFDLSGASDDERFRVNDIIHQISLEVTETGTEAAAITTGSVDYSGDVKVFKVDRPFLFIIRHEPSRVNLFYGVIVDPTNGRSE